MDLMDNFTFYLGFTKTLVLNLPNPKDRSIAALWIKKLCEIHEKNAEDSVHVEYLKLLLLVMHGNNFSTFFEKLPPEGDLEPININEEISAIEPPVKSKTYPFVYTSVSGDLCEFVAIQEIPNHGLHGYYAVSKRPLSNWIHAKKISHNKDGEDDFGNLLHPTAPRNESSQNLEMEAETVKESENQNKTSPRKMLKDNVSRRREIIEARPCWGTNRYIERLIDESPYFISDLELSQADAFLHNFKNRKMKEVRKGSIERPFLLSSKRKQVERMMDLPRCAIDPGEQDIMPEISRSKGAHFTCVPKERMKIDINYFDSCVNEDEEYEEYEEDAFLYPRRRKYKSTPETQISSRSRIKNDMKPLRTSERVSARNYSSDQNELEYVDDGRLDDNDNSTERSSKRKSRFHKSVSSDPTVQETSFRKDFTYGRGASVSLPSHLRNLSSRNESMGSYGPVSSFSNETGPPMTQSRNFGTLSNDTSGQRRKNRSHGLTSQDFVSLRTEIGESEEERQYFENLFPNQSQVNSIHLSRRVNFPSEPEIRSYCRED